MCGGRHARWRNGNFAVDEIQHRRPAEQFVLGRRYALDNRCDPLIAARVGGLVFEASEYLGQRNLARVPRQEKLVTAITER